MHSCEKRLERARRIVEEELGVSADAAGSSMRFELDFEGGYPPGRDEEAEMDRIEDEAMAVLSKIEELGLKAWARWDWCCGVWTFGVEVAC